MSLLLKEEMTLGDQWSVNWVSFWVGDIGVFVIVLIRNFKLALSPFDNVVSNLLADIV